MRIVYLLSFLFFIVPVSEMLSMDEKKTKEKIDKRVQIEIEDPCLICQNELEPGENVVLLSCCFKNFHKKCLTNWYFNPHKHGKNRVNDCCPNCRKPIIEVGIPSVTNVYPYSHRSNRGNQRNFNTIHLNNFFGSFWAKVGMTFLIPTLPVLVYLIPRLLLKDFSFKTFDDNNDIKIYPDGLICIIFIMAHCLDIAYFSEFCYQYRGNRLLFIFLRFCSIIFQLGLLNEFHSLFKPLIPPPKQSSWW